MPNAARPSSSRSSASPPRPPAASPAWWRFPARRWCRRLSCASPNMRTPSDRNSGRNSDSAHRRCRGRYRGEYAALRQGDRGHGAALSRAVSMDASALSHPATRHGADLSAQANLTCGLADCGVARRAIAAASAENERDRPRRGRRNQRHRTGPRSIAKPARRHGQSTARSSRPARSRRAGRSRTRPFRSQKRLAEDHPEQKQPDRASAPRQSDGPVARRWRRDLAVRRPGGIRSDNNAPAIAPDARPQ